MQLLRSEPRLPSVWKRMRTLRPGHCAYETMLSPSFEVEISYEQAPMQSSTRSFAAVTSCVDARYDEAGKVIEKRTEIQLILF
jgi:hypothetical protein